MRLYLFVFGLITTVLTAFADPGRTVLAKGLFSYEAPPGWFVHPQANSVYLVASSGKGTQDFGSILVSSERMSSLNQASGAFRQFLQKERMHIVDQRSFSTAAGLSGLRIEATGPILAGLDNRPERRVAYLFYIGYGRVLVINATCAQAMSKEDVPLFDAAMKSFSLE